VLTIGGATVHHGDCRDVLRALAAEGVTVDSVVTDPPYHLTTVKRFGAADAAPAKYGTDGLFQRASRGFMGKEWDGGGIAFDPATWRAVYDVMKPGAHLAAFGGTRTFHRMAVAIEDAGFEVRDTLAWLYGTGFPKSHDVSKAIDKAAGAEREVIAPRPGVTKTFNVGANVVIKPRDPITAPATDAAREWAGWGTALKPAFEPIILARKPLIGTVAENVLRHGTGAINVDACRVGTDITVTRRNGNSGGVKFGRDERVGSWENPPGRFPANVLHDGSDEVLEAFAAYGEKASGQKVGGQYARASGVHDGGQRLDGIACYGDSGTAARFFYCAKASARDRAGSKHPTVKPVPLIEWLTRLITPPRGVVLDPFAGSGTLGAAWPNCILIEREAEYFIDIAARLGRCAA